MTTIAAQSTSPTGWALFLETARSSAVSMVRTCYERIFSFQTDECSKCRAAFNSHVFDLPSEDAMSAAQAERCHGCLITGLTLRLLCPIMEAKWGRSLVFRSLALNSNLEMTKIDLTTEDNGLSRTEALEIFKSATEPPGYVTRWLDWMKAVFSFPRQTRQLPQFLCRAYEQRRISGYTGSPEAFETAFSWFEKCTTTHGACRDDSEPPVVPTRVIDFSSKDSLRLVESQGARGPYLCLSHRWLSDKDMFRCTHDNLEQLKQNIKWDSLTRTFQHALTFAQAFSAWHHKTYPERETIRYIWIDSICIVQDSSEDWEKEAGRMCSVYENAVLTIAGAVGGNGCFAVADQLFKGFEITSPRHRHTQLYLRRPLPHFGLGNISVLRRTSINDDPGERSLDLLTRGWVLQERLLSKRFLIFGPHELLWECSESVDCECRFLTNQSVSTTLNSHETANYWKNVYNTFQKDNPNNLANSAPLKIAHFRSLSEQDQGHSQEWWQRIVEVYTRTSLTKASDRLPALAGLAAQFSQLDTSRQYLAGVWTGMLIESLTWFVEESPGTERIIAYNRTSESPIAIPSWSWASCSRPVQFTGRAGYRTKLFASVTTTKYAAASANNPFGNCSYGILVLHGPVYWGLTKQVWNNDVDRKYPRCTYYSDGGGEPTDPPPNPDKYVLMSFFDDPRDSAQLANGWIFLHLGLALLAWTHDDVDTFLNTAHE